MAMAACFLFGFLMTILPVMMHYDPTPEITNKYLDAEEETASKPRKTKTSTYKDGVTTKIALRNKYKIEPKSIPEGNKVSKVFKVKESKKGNTAEVEFTSKEGKTRGEVTLNEITPTVDPKASRDIVDKAVKRDTIEKATATRRAAADAEFVKSFGAQERSFDNAEQVLKDVDELNKTLPKGQKIKISKEDRKADCECAI
mgnify:CR=1 FL=1